ARACGNTPRTHGQGQSVSRYCQRCDGSRVRPQRHAMGSGGGMRGRWLAGLGLLAVAGSAQAAELSRALPTKAPPPATSSAADVWPGFYAGGHFSYAAVFSNWTATQAGAATPSLSGALDMVQGYDFSTGRGSYLLGLQAGY